MARLPESTPAEPTQTSQDDESLLDGSAVETYLARIDIDPASVEEADFDTLARIQRAHVTAVPFENLDIVGDPHDADATGPGIPLSIPSLHEKIVERERGGYCFELNGLFHDLLGALEYEVDRVATRVDGGLTVPANHHANVVTLDQRYVDIGTGVPMLRQPIPFDGTVVVDEIGVRWRLTKCPRPDEEYQTEYASPVTTSGVRATSSATSPVTAGTSRPRTTTSSPPRDTPSPTVRPSRSPRPRAT